VLPVTAGIRDGVAQSVSNSGGGVVSSSRAQQQQGSTDEGVLVDRETASVNGRGGASSESPLGSRLSTFTCGGGGLPVLSSVVSAAAWLPRPPRPLRPRPLPSPAPRPPVALLEAAAAAAAAAASLRARGGMPPDTDGAQSTEGAGRAHASRAASRSSSATWKRTTGSSVTAVGVEAPVVAPRAGSVHPRSATTARGGGG
jgi:hypothetical protein